MQLQATQPFYKNAQDKADYLNSITEKNFVKGEDLNKDAYMPFSISEPEFDMSKFSGRFQSFLKVSNPLHAFYGNKRIREF